jgi:hypothetical protein
MMRLAVGTWILAGLSLWAAEAPYEQARLSTTEHLNFAPGGTIRVSGSWGCLSVEGWDRPEVEVTVSRYGSVFYPPAKREAAAQKLAKVKVQVERKSDHEAAVTTTGGGHWKTVELESVIRVPRDSHIEIHHGGGQVIITNVAGEIEASAKEGDITALLPDPGPFAIDARTRLGTVYSDFGNPTHTWYLVGEHFDAAKPAPAKRVYLRTRVGGIEIQEMAAGGY